MPSINNNNQWDGIFHPTKYVQNPERQSRESILEMRKLRPQLAQDDTCVFLLVSRPLHSSWENTPLQL